MAASPDQPPVTFYRAWPAAIAPMRADKAALGTVPTLAYRHCEPLRAASGFGWYVFPPIEITLRWNGSDVLLAVGDEWLPLGDAQLPGMAEVWDAHCPEAMRGLAPPYLSAIPARGVVQVWSGFLVGAEPGWSLLVRPLVNVPRSRLYESFEGLVEIDSFRPSPLFTNLQLIATDCPIHLSKNNPLFQVQPILRASHSDAALGFRERDVFDAKGGGLSAQEWDAYRSTIRVDLPEAPLQSGRYTIAARKRARHEDS